MPPKHTTKQDVLGNQLKFQESTSIYGLEQKDTSPELSLDDYEKFADSSYEDTQVSISEEADIRKITANLKKYISKEYTALNLEKITDHEKIQRKLSAFYEKQKIVFTETLNHFIAKETHKMEKQLENLMENRADAPSSVSQKDWDILKNRPWYKGFKNDVLWKTIVLQYTANFAISANDAAEHFKKECDNAISKLNPGIEIRLKDKKDSLLHKFLGTLLKIVTFNKSTYNTDRAKSIQKCIDTIADKENKEYKISDTINDSKTDNASDDTANDDEDKYTF